MKVYITRHGQPAIDGLEPGMNHELPPGDPPLSKLGRRQSAVLGRHLKSLGFAGRVLASPYARTSETASVICGETGLSFHPEPDIQEIRFVPQKPHAGLTLDQIAERFPNLAPDAALRHPWMVEGAETGTDVWLRVKNYAEGLDLSEDILFVGHGASVNALKRYFAELTGAKIEDKFNWNCSLSCFELLPEGKWRTVLVSDVSFMDREIVTSNNKRKLTNEDSQ